MTPFKSGFFGPLDWAQALAERKLTLIPGPLHTSLNPGRIGDPYASVCLNCNTQNGDWRLDKRYRQFQATPAAGTAGGIGYGEVTLNDVQRFTMSVAGGAATGGTFTLTAPTELGGGTTGAIAYNATAATIRTAVEALTGVETGDVIVQGGGSSSNAFTIEHVGQFLGRNVSSWTADGALLTGPGSPYTFTIAVSGAGGAQGGAYEEYVAIQNNALYSIAASELTNSDGSVATAWTTLTDPGIANTADWIFWTFQKFIFLATEQSSQKVMYKTIGLNDAKILREFVGQAADGSVELAIPPYESHVAISGTDVVTASATAQGTMNSEGIDASGAVVLDITAPTTSQNNVLVTLYIDYDATNRPNLNNNDYIGLITDATFPFTLTQVQDVYLEDDAGTLTQLQIRVDIQANSARVHCNLQGIPYSSRDAATGIRVRLRVNMQQGRGRIRLLPIAIGGVFLEAGHSALPNIEVPPPNRPDPQWGFRYFRDIATFSDLHKLGLNRDLALGEKWSANLPHMGAHAKIVIPDISTLGFVSTDRIQLFRRTSLSADRTPGGPRSWFLLTEAANSADLSFTDDMTQQRVIQDKQDYGDVDIPGTVSSLTSREVSGVTWGCEWKGSNCFFKIDGRLYGSASNRPFEVLWAGVTLEVDPNQVGKPRTLQITNNGLPIITGASQDALYMFSRKEGWAINGETLGSAGFPQRIPGVRGALGRAAATKYKDGALFAADDGLFYVEVPRYFSGETGERILEEMTEKVRPDWTNLIETTPENTIVVESASDIWVLNGANYLHSPKPFDGQERFWIPGTWANGKSVQAAWGDPRRGIVLQMTDGTVGLIGDFLSDGGTNAAGDNGTRPSWSWTGKRFNIPVNIEAVRCFFSKSTLQSAGADISNLRVRLNCEQLASSEDAATLTMDASDGVQVDSWPRISSGGSSGANRWWEIGILGAAGDVFNNVELQISPSDWGRGP